MKTELQISQDEIAESIAKLEEMVEIYKELGQYHQRFHAENEIKRLRKLLIKHKWVIGGFVRKDIGDRYLTREDECALCGCKRTSIKTPVRGGGIMQFVTSYQRSKAVYPEDHEPSCWGAKNPE